MSHPFKMALTSSYIADLSGSTIDAMSSLIDVH